MVAEKKARRTAATTIGVAGGSGSGKTTVAQTILRTVGASRIAFLVQDAYYRDIEWRDPEELRRHNFDHPDALDTDLLVEQLAALRAGRDVEVPVYDFVGHRRRPETKRTGARPVVLVEGILLFAEPRVRDLLDFKIFVDTDADVRLIRRLMRDVEERGRTVPDVIRQYLETVRPMHLEFIEPSKRWADVIVPEGGENRVAMEMVTARIEQLLSGGR
ncbi:MAG TPA: uridine kinase [Thermoanaerobaculia bacterium]|nr:uridine kinase [Thermoanaerobaculia bacterium]